MLQIKPEIELKEPILSDDAKVKEYETFLNTKPHSIEKNGVEMVTELIKDHKYDYLYSESSDYNNLMFF